MKKLIYTISIAALALSSCLKAEFEPEFTSGLVDVKFDIEVAEAGVATKAFADTPDLQTLHVAVFDNNGFKVGFHKAELVGTSNPSVYTYKVSLVSSEEPRVLHFIGNCPEADADMISSTYGNEMSLVSALRTSGNADAYWQRKELAQISADAAEVKAALGTVFLVRNFAKVTLVSETANFEITGIKVCGVPTSGFMAPYYATGAQAGLFVPSYQDKSYDELVESGYAGHVPSDAAFTDLSSAYVAPVDGIATAYVYEVTKESAPYVIVKGIFRSGSEETECYYKVNIVDHSSREYALLRNFNFKAKIVRVSKPGAATEAEAASSAGSGDVSVLTAFEPATNISDAQSQLFVNKTSATVIQRSTIEIKYKYIPDLTAPTTVNNNVRADEADDTKPVEIVLEDGSAIEDFQVSETDVDGFRTITVNTCDPGTEVLEQKLLIRGHGKIGSEYSGNIVIRTITISVRPRLLLTASCPERIVEGTDKALPVTIGVQDGLPESIFPLNLNIEPVMATLAPASGESLPVATGVSLTGSGKPAYYFVKNLSYAEYAAASSSKVDGVDYRNIICNFITNVDDASSRIVVTSELFNTADCVFFSGMKKFTDVTIAPVKVGSGEKTTLSFRNSELTPFTITLTNATIAGTASYVYTPTSVGLQEFEVVATSYGRPVMATISASQYADASAVRNRYVDFQPRTVSAIFSNEPVAFGRGNTANMEMKVGLDATTALATAEFAATRRSAFDAPSGKATITRNSTSYIIYTSRRYSYVINLANYDSSLSYSYSTNGTSYTAMPSNWTISDLSASTIYVKASDGTREAVSTVTWSGNNDGTRDFDFVKVSDGYDYSAEGPNSPVRVEFNAAVTATTKVYLFYSNGSNTGSNNVLTVNNLATGTAGTATTLNF